MQSKTTTCRYSLAGREKKRDNDYRTGQQILSQNVQQFSIGRNIQYLRSVWSKIICNAFCKSDYIDEEGGNYNMEAEANSGLFSYEDENQFYDPANI